MSDDLRIGWVGQPGERAFHIQLAQPFQQTILCEKMQIGGIALLLENLLERTGKEPADAVEHRAFALEPFDEADWRGGTIVVAISDDMTSFSLRVSEAGADEDDPGTLSAHSEFDLETARQLAGHCRWAVDQGRPAGEDGPVIKDARGHVVFPSTNGHGLVNNVATPALPDPDETGAS